MKTVKTSTTRFSDGSTFTYETFSTNTSPRKHSKSLIFGAGSLFLMVASIVLLFRSFTDPDTVSEYTMLSEFINFFAQTSDAVSGILMSALNAFRAVSSWGGAFSPEMGFLDTLKYIASVIAQLGLIVYLIACMILNAIYYLGAAMGFLLLNVNG